MNIFRKFFAYLRIREAVRLADSIHQSTANRCFVLPDTSGGGTPRLIVMDRRNFRRLKQKGYISDRIFTGDLLRECFYHTPCRDGSGIIPENIRRLKIGQYFAWYETQIKASKKKK